MAHRHDDFPKDRIVSPDSQENESLSSGFYTRAREYHRHQLAADELQAVAEFTNDPHARSHAHHRNISRAHTRVGKDEAGRKGREARWRREVSKVKLDLKPRRYTVIAGFSFFSGQER